MSNLFTLPEQVPLTVAGKVMPGAKAFFYLTGTTTPKNTYSDSGLSVPHPNPVVADSGGAFPAVFLDTSATEYRVRIESSAGVLLYQQDNVGDRISQAEFNALLTTAGAQVLGGLLFPQTAAETDAAITPALYAFEPGDMLRYYNGGGDYGNAIRAMYNAILSGETRRGDMGRGIYPTSTGVTFDFAPISGPSGANRGIAINAYGAAVQYSGTGYFLDVITSNTSASFYGPTMVHSGLNVTGTAGGLGAFRIENMSNTRWYDCYAFSFSTGYGFSLVNTNNLFSELNTFANCGVVGCGFGMGFGVSGGLDSFARTLVTHFFGASIVNHWFDIGTGASVYDSLFEHIVGNFNSLSYFRIIGDMTGTEIRELSAELNATQAGQSIIRLNNYPSVGNTRRPRLVNVGPFAGFTGSGFIPTWGDSTGAAVPGPEDLQRQATNLENALSVNQGSIACVPGLIRNGPAGQYIGGSQADAVVGTWYAIPNTSLGIADMQFSTGANDGPKYGFGLAKISSGGTGTVTARQANASTGGQSIEARWQAGTGIEFRLVGGSNATVFWNGLYMQ